MVAFSLNSENLFLRNAGKGQVMVVKLTKDVHSSVVETKDWEVVDIIGANMSYVTLEIFSHKLQGKKLKSLAMNLSESRLWVNREGTSFVRLGANGLPIHAVFYRTNDVFDWAQFGVNKFIANDDGDEDDKSLEDLKKELDEYKKRLQVKEDEIKKLKEKTPEKKEDQAKKDDDDAEMKKLQGKVDKSIQDFDKIKKDLEAEKHKVAQLEEDVKNKGKEITTLNDKLKEAQGTKHELEAMEHKVTQLEEDVKHKSKEITALNEKLKEANGAEHELEATKHKVTKLEEDVRHKSEEISTLNDKLKEALNQKHDLDGRISKLTEDLRKCREENQKLTSSSSSSSSSIASAITQYDQILHKWRRPVLATRFNTVGSNYSLYYSPDFSSMPTYRAVDEYIQGRYPSNINVYVSNGPFQKDNWWFIKIRDESSGYQSFFAFYGGIYDTIVTYPGSHQVKVPYTSSASLRANVRFQAVALRGYGAVFGFCYA